MVISIVMLVYQRVYVTKHDINITSGVGNIGRCVKIMYSLLLETILLRINAYIAVTAMLTNTIMNIIFIFIYTCIMYIYIYI